MAKAYRTRDKEIGVIGTPVRESVPHSLKPFTINGRIQPCWNGNAAYTTHQSVFLLACISQPYVAVTRHHGGRIVPADRSIQGSSS